MRPGLALILAASLSAALPLPPEGGSHAGSAVPAGARVWLPPSGGRLLAGSRARVWLPPSGGRPAAGTIRGRIDVRVERSLLDARPDPGALGMGQARDPRERRSSVVYLETVPRSAFEPGEDRRARLDQRDERFVPHVLAVTAGTWVDFPNGDTTYHNVFSLSKGNEFDLGRYAAGRSRAVRFDRPGVVRVFCEIHSHMSAFILVFAHRFFAVTDDEGRYRIDGVPPGTYTLAVWNETLHGDPPRRQITVGEGGGDVAADFSIR